MGFRFTFFLCFFSNLLRDLGYVQTPYSTYAIPNYRSPPFESGIDLMSISNLQNHDTPNSSLPLSIPPDYVRGNILDHMQRLSLDTLGEAASTHLEIFEKNLCAILQPLFRRKLAMMELEKLQTAATVLEGLSGLKISPAKSSGSIKASRSKSAKRKRKSVRNKDPISLEHILQLKDKIIRASKPAKPAPKTSQKPSEWADDLTITLLSKTTICDDVINLFLSLEHRDKLEGKAKNSKTTKECNKYLKNTHTFLTELKKYVEGVRSGNVLVHYRTFTSVFSIFQVRFIFYLLILPHICIRTCTKNIQD